jgi:hypothetical protein
VPTVSDPHSRRLSGFEHFCSIFNVIHLDDAQYEAASGVGGADRDRTGDPLLAKQVLSQLSYSPI